MLPEVALRSSFANAASFSKPVFSSFLVSVPRIALPTHVTQPHAYASLAKGMLKRLRHGLVQSRNTPDS